MEHSEKDILLRIESHLRTIKQWAMLFGFTFLGLLGLGVLYILQVNGLF